MDILVTKDSKGKIRVVEIDGRWNDEDRGYYITRTTYQLGGKRTEQPSIFINQGKAKRTVLEQFKLEYNSHVKKYTDKGYKLLSSSVNINNIAEVTQFVKESMPDGITDANGFKKHMLAKQADTVTTKVLESLDYWYGSRKIDGLRCSLYWQNDHIETASRGGQKYSGISHITKNPKLIEFFKKHPDYILDGELYKHGLSLQQISGLVRREEESPVLEYYIYDVMDGDKTFENRKVVLDDIAEELSLGFNPEKEWEIGDLKLQMVPQEKVKGWLSMEKLHNKYVAEGWEGLVIRDPNAVYKFGSRSNSMIKIKHYLDSEFTITGISEGLRDEDMCFTLVTDEGKEFKAKPWGSRELKQQYRNDLPNLIGKKATVKYFYMSDESVPLQPSVKCIRDYE